eukprot:GHRR01001114.1.p1 GENE.GHRR01001114.1~~GHRR01001114.1.p1  ORF type:complete len:330 (+),score=116.40 GHRR01001114.1:142-990(+)
MALAQCSWKVASSAAAATNRRMASPIAAAPAAAAPRMVRRSQLVAVNSPCSCNNHAAAVVMRSASTDAARWTQQVQNGNVSSISTKAAGEMMQQGWVLLDVRPPGEVNKVAVTAAVDVPLYVEDPSNSPASLLKKAATIGTGGWWVGGTHMIPNNSFLAQVQSQIPKEASIVIGCQKGLRSLAAAEQLSRAGYTKLAWINGGFDTARPGDLPTANDKDLRFAGIGGLSELLGWTEVQQEVGKGQGFMGGVNNILKIVALVLAADMALFVYEQLAYMQGNSLQ